MSYALHLSFPSYGFLYPVRSRKRGIVAHARPSPNPELNGEPHEQTTSGRDQAEVEPRLILVERYSDGTSKRYVLHEEDSRLQTSLEVKDQRSTSNGFDFSDSELSWLPDPVKEFVFPGGFPGSVSDDYLEYMLLQFPTNVTAWICHALAVGVGSFSGTTAAASAAAIRWVSKDGIGAVGRLLIGGRFGSLFDDDPKQWRMYADFIGSAGSIFDLSTQLYPTYFLPLASLGNLTKAVARGLKDPSFRVIQNHFAISGNLGEVAAKEEVWEVAAQLLGLALGILILDTPGLVKSYPSLAFTWTSMRLLHLWLRYQSLTALKFDTINLKRACILVKSHVVSANIPGCDECNKRENILLWQRFLKPRIIFGVSFEEMVNGDISVLMAKELLRLYSKEKYILTVDQRGNDFEVLVAFKVGATSLSVLRSVWQACWLHENCGVSHNVLDQLAQSLLDMEKRFENFMEQLEEAEWDIHNLNLKVTSEIFIDEIVTS
ncbi:hypothetical protein CRG98_045055 [Punica granatum]|uniref:Protein root UVB sensitive 5 n=1 Tax=Punica granatum TaxID=22663 RepID=A0A2I0HS20_PUNGR|nr:hypothetical protein CRG98_045055 [Punica granatum]